MTCRLIVLTGVVLAAAICLHARPAEERPPVSRPLAERAVAGWKAAGEQQFDPTTAAVLRADDYVWRTYVRPARDEADLFVGYYESQRQGDTVHSPMNCLPAAGWQLLTMDRASIDGGGRA